MATGLQFQLECLEKSLQQFTVTKKSPILSTTNLALEETKLLDDICSVVVQQTDEVSSISDERLGEVLHSLLERRLCNTDWLTANPTVKWLSSVVQLARILLRRRPLQDEFFGWSLTEAFVALGQHCIGVYFVPNRTEATQIARGYLSMAQKLASGEAHCVALADAALHSAVLRLLASRDMAVLQGALQLLFVLCERSEAARVQLCATNVLDQALQLIKEADLLTQKLCASLLRVLCGESEAREQIKVYDGVPVLLRLLLTRNVRLQWHVAWTLAQLAEDSDTAFELGQMGAVPLLLSEFTTVSESPSRSLDDWLTMLTALGALLAQLCKVDSNALQIVLDNGIYLFCRLLLLQTQHPDWQQNRNYFLLQCSLFRLLRLLFSLERNRPPFKRLFPADFFAKFIDIGHYVQELSAYEPLVRDFASVLSDGEVDVQRAVDEVNRQRAPIGQISVYAVLEQLGAGAFGCVYRVSTAAAVDRSAKTFALKEIFMHHTTGERDADGVERSFGDVINEVKIIKQQLRHPNIVRYRRVFVEAEKLYILMDLIEGAPLKEFIISQKEKGQRFSEDRVWAIVVQMLLALRYLHKEKRIIHRDLKPNNVMLTDSDRVVITDFGLAKQRGDSYLRSQAGTILYSCPEIVQSQPYAEKADVWSLGCIVYEMCMLQPPFYSQNWLHLATVIVEARYDAVPTDFYSEELVQLVDRQVDSASRGAQQSRFSCLTADPHERPDIVGAAQLATSRLMLCIDEVVRQQHSQLQRRLRSSAESSRSAQSSLSASSSSWSDAAHAEPQSRATTTQQQGDGAATAQPIRRPMAARVTREPSRPSDALVDAAVERGRRPCCRAAFRGRRPCRRGGGR